MKTLNLAIISNPNPQLSAPNRNHLKSIQGGKESPREQDFLVKFSVDDVHTKNLKQLAKDAKKEGCSRMVVVAFLHSDAA
jgi:hypothetical protein